MILTTDTTTMTTSIAAPATSTQHHIQTTTGSRKPATTISVLQSVITIKGWSWVTLLIVGLLNLAVLAALFIYMCHNDSARKKKAKGPPSGLKKSKGVRNCFGLCGGSREDAEMGKEDYGGRSGSRHP